MTVKHQPDTEADILVVATVHVDGTRGDSEYIAHAANAYPKLVEALRSIRDMAEGSDDLVIEGVARDLLRELGEDA